MLFRSQVPISFHRTLRSSSAPSASTAPRHLDHPYVASTVIGGPVVPALQRGWEAVEREPVMVCSPTPAVEEAAQDPSPATRFLLLLEEELQPESYILPRDSQGFLVDLLRTIVVALKLEDPNTSHLSLISQELAIRTPSLDPNDLTDLLSKTGGLVYPDPSASSAVVRVGNPGISYLDLLILIPCSRVIFTDLFLRYSYYKGPDPYL